MPTTTEQSVPATVATAAPVTCAGHGGNGHGGDFQMVLANGGGVLLVRPDVALKLTAHGLQLQCRRCGRPVA